MVKFVDLLIVIYKCFTKGSDELLGKFVDVKITEATRTSLKGEIYNNA